MKMSHSCEWCISEDKQWTTPPKFLFDLILTASACENKIKQDVLGIVHLLLLIRQMYKTLPEIQLGGRYEAQLLLYPLRYKEEQFRKDALAFWLSFVIK